MTEPVATEKRGRLLLVAALAFVLIATVIVAICLRVTLPHPGTDPVRITIASGMTAADVGQLLADRGIIRSRLCFRLTARLADCDRLFKAGDHELAAPLTMGGLVSMLTKPPLPPPFARVTIPEGLTIGETAAAVARQCAIDSASFAGLARDRTVAAALGIDSGSLEGYLYPDTYFISPPGDARSLIGRMVRQFRQVTGNWAAARADSLGMTLHEAVTLASIIQAEAGRPGEVPLISQVFHRRLRLGRPLEANPTVQYALGSRRRVMYGDLKVNSPYNTYRHAGLPPGPIGSPGIEAILAALHPADTDFLYFMADGGGGHVFSRTLAEHVKVVRRYRTRR
jgi:UPF0755 protein